MSVRFVEEGQIAFETILALKSLYLLFHGRQICRQFEGGVIVEMNVVVRFTLENVDPLVFHRRPKVLECFVEELRK